MTQPFTQVGPELTDSERRRNQLSLRVFDTCEANPDQAEAYYGQLVRIGRELQGRANNRRRRRRIQVGLEIIDAAFAAHRGMDIPAIGS